MSKIHSSCLCPKKGNNWAAVTREVFLTLNFADQCSCCLNREVKNMSKEEQIKFWQLKLEEATTSIARYPDLLHFKNVRERRFMDSIKMKYYCKAKLNMIFNLF